jgi:DICT domain-containing protein
MDLRETIEFIGTFEKELSLFNVPAADPLASELAAFFDTQNVRITSHQTASAAPRVAVLSNRDEVLAIADPSELRALAGGDATTADDVGVADSRYESILGHLKETTFTSYDTAEMVAASREIEERAHRRGRGTIHAGFQRCSVMADQQAVYTALAERGLAVHAYGVPDERPPDLGASQVHATQTDEVATTWFVVYDGGGDEHQKCALLARERAPDTFDGAWTYDPALVDSVCARLDRRYCSTDDGRVHTDST